MSEESSNNIAIWVGGTICAAVGLAVILYFLRYVLESVFYVFFVCSLSSLKFIAIKILNYYYSQSLSLEDAKQFNTF